MFFMNNESVIDGNEMSISPGAIFNQIAHIPNSVLQLLVNQYIYQYVSLAIYLFINLIFLSIYLYDTGETVLNIKIIS